MKSKKISVLGAGSWGTVLAHLFSLSGHSVCLWARSKEFVEHVKTTGRFVRPIELPLPESIHLTSDLSECLKFGELVVSAIPSEAVSEVVSRVKESGVNINVLLSATKGLDQQSGESITDIWAKTFKCQVAAISGPNLSAEVASAKPMRTIVASNDLVTARYIQELFNLQNFKVEISQDLSGIEMAGAVKNVIALAAGSWDGLNLGTSGKGAMLTRALDEMALLVEKMGGQRQTAYSVAGIGDLYITCSSKLSRNYQTGFMLGEGKPLEQIKSFLQGQIAEGVWTTPLLHRLAQNLKIDLKVCEAVYKMLQENGSSRRHLEESFMELV